MTTETDNKKGESNFFTKEEEKDLKGYFRSVTYGILFLGDSDLRRATEQDRIGITSTLKKAQEVSRDKESKGPPYDIKNAFGFFESIINGKAEHSILGKVYALMAYVDLASEMKNWPGSFKNVLNAVRQEADIRNKIIMAGALYSRAGYHWTEKPETAHMYTTLETSLTGRVLTKEQAKNKLGIHVVAALLAELKEKDMLFLQLPWVVVTKGETVENEWESPGQGYPDRTIYLSNLYTPSFEKMEEAVVYGIPDNLRRVNIRRIQRLLIGVETVGELDNGDIGKKVEKIHISKRRFYHVSIRPIRRPKDSAEQDVFSNISFDSLSFVLSVKLSRELRDDFKEIDGTEYPKFSVAKANIRREQRKVEAVERQVEKIMNRINTPLIERASDNRQLGILSLAAEESQGIDGTKNWGIDEIVEYLKLNLKNLVLSGNSLRLRDETEIANLYVNYLWKNELSNVEKLDMAKAILRDPEHPIWIKVPPSFHQPLVDFAHRGISMNENVTQYILKILEKGYLVLHCETIRDTFEPEKLGEVIGRIVESNKSN